jgi:hypothetical protein
MNQILEQTSDAGETPSAAIRKHGDAAIRTDAVNVVFTTLEDTLAAVRLAQSLAKALAVPLTLMYFRPASSAVPVDAPNGVSTVETDAFVNRLRAEGVDVRVRIFLCGNVRQALRLAFRRHSLIVIGGRRRWWPTAAERWRRALEAAGHFVLFVNKSGRMEEANA